MSENKATIYYHDIGDYLDRDKKLKIIKEYGSVKNPKMEWTIITPNEKHDWINQRDGVFDNLLPLAPEKKGDIKAESFFVTYAIGLSSNRDSWVYNFSFNAVEKNMQRMIQYYNDQRELYLSKTKNIAEDKDKPKVEDIISNDSTRISWTVNLRNDAFKNINRKFIPTDILIGVYRPFQKQNLYLSEGFIERPGLSKKLFPTVKTKNLVICFSDAKSPTVSITDINPDLHFNGDSQCFPLYYYEENTGTAKSLFDDDTNDKYIRRDGITDWILKEVRSRFPGSGRALTKEHIFYYVYGILHSKQYRKRFASDLKKSLPRIPIADDVNTFMDFSNAGKKLAALHLNYEDVPSYDGVTVEAIKPATYQKKSETNILNYGELIAASPSWESDNSFDEYEYYRVEKMRFPSKDQKDTIIYNHYITIKNIPAKAYEYIVNGKSAIEWIMERYAVTVDKDSLIKNDPNDWSREHNKPRYILDLLLSVINVSVQTVDVVNGLPAVKVE